MVENSAPSAMPMYTLSAQWIFFGILLWCQSHSMYVCSYTQKYRIWQFRDRAHYASSIVWLNDMLVCNGECDTDTGYRAPKPTFSNFSHIIIRQNASYLLRGTHRAKGKKRATNAKEKRLKSLNDVTLFCFGAPFATIAFEMLSQLFAHMLATE